MTYEYCSDGKPGPVTLKLYNKLVAIQNGDEPDQFGWMTVVE
jgi:branched-chain amino acid aminotransferase